MRLFSSLIFVFRDPRLPYGEKAIAFLLFPCNMKCPLKRKNPLKTVFERVFNLDLCL